MPFREAGDNTGCSCSQFICGVGLVSPGRIKPHVIEPGVVAWAGAAWTFVIFNLHIQGNRMKVNGDSDGATVGQVRDERFWASLLCSAAVFMHYYD